MHATRPVYWNCSKYGRVQYVVIWSLSSTLRHFRYQSRSRCSVSQRHFMALYKIPTSNRDLILCPTVGMAWVVSTQWQPPQPPSALRWVASPRHVTGGVRCCSPTPCRRGSKRLKSRVLGTGSCDVGFRVCLVPKGCSLSEEK